NTARYLLATQLWSLKRFEEAVPVFREALKLESDRAVLEELRYLLATSLANLGKREDARAALPEVVQRGGKYGSHARAQLAELEASAAAEAKPPVAAEPKPPVATADKPPVATAPAPAPSTPGA